MSQLPRWFLTCSRPIILNDANQSLSEEVPAAAPRYRTREAFPPRTL